MFEHNNMDFDFFNILKKKFDENLGRGNGYKLNLFRKISKTPSIIYYNILSMDIQITFHKYTLVL
jgi:hypothetical protein